MPRARTEETLQAVMRRYDALAEGCDSLSCGSTLEAGAPAPGEVAIDLGCGRGADVRAASARVGADGLAIGVDLSAEMLLRAASAGQGRWLRCELDGLALADACADLVTSSCSINHARDKAAVYREIHRVLRPGGRFVVADIVAEETLPEQVRADPAAWAACYGGAIPELEYLAAVRAAGFAAPQVLRRSSPYQRAGVTLRSITIRGRRPGHEER